MDLDEEIKSREEGEIGSESREKGDLLPCSFPLLKMKNRKVRLMKPTHDVLVSLASPFYDLALHLCVLSTI